LRFAVTHDPAIALKPALRMLRVIIVNGQAVQRFAPQNFLRRALSVGNIAREAGR